MQKNRGLGRGLDALFGSSTDALKADDAPQGYQLKEISVELLKPSPFQARQSMDDEALVQLSQSIREQGLLNPIVVRLTALGDHEIVAGERRYRAAKMAGLATVPVLIREFTDEESMMLGLVENLQREDLNPMDEAQGLERLIEEFGLTHERVAETLGKNRSTITNMLRLLSLAPTVQDWVRERKLSMGHARALLPLTPAQQIQCAQEVIQKGLSVRETEQWVRRLQESPKPKTVKKSADDKALELRLSERLGAQVAVSANKKGRGKLVINFTSLDQLQGIIEHIERDHF